MLTYAAKLQLEVQGALETHYEQTRSFSQMRGSFRRFIGCFACPAKQQQEESNVCLDVSAIVEVAGVSIPEGT